MRLSAYKTALRQIKDRVPGHIPELDSYFNDHYSPLQAAIDHTIRIARQDNCLFDTELHELIEFRNNIVRGT